MMMNATRYKTMRDQVLEGKRSPRASPTSKQKQEYLGQTHFDNGRTKKARADNSASGKIKDAQDTWIVHVERATLSHHAKGLMFQTKNMISNLITD